MLCELKEIQAYWFFTPFSFVEIQRAQSYFSQTSTTYGWWHRVKCSSLQNDFKSPHGWPKKNKVFKGTAKKCDLSEKVTFNVVSVPNVQNVFFNAIQSVSLNIIKPWSVTYPCIIDLFQKMQYEVNYTINSKVSLRRGDIVKINETLFGGGKLLIELSMKLQEAPRSQGY